MVALAVATGDADARRSNRRREVDGGLTFGCDEISKRAVLDATAIDLRLGDAQDRGVDIYILAPR